MIVTLCEMASVLDEAPSSALSGLGAPDERVRAPARLELAEHLLRRLAGAARPDDKDQLALPLA